MLIALLGAVTIATYMMSSEAARDRLVTSFDQSTDRGLATLESRLAQHERALFVTRMFLDSSDDVTDADWSSFAGSLELAGQLPSITALAYVEESGDGLSITRLAMESGSDGFAEALIGSPEFRQAAEASAEENAVRLTPPIDGAIAMVLARAPADSATDPGWIMARVDLDALFASIGEHPYYALNIVDRASGRPLIEADGLPVSEPLVTRSMTVPVSGRDWRMHWVSTDAFEADHRDNSAWIVLAACLCVCGLIGTLLVVVARHEMAIRKTVELRTRELTAREDLNRSIIDNEISAMLIIDDDEVVIGGNDAAAQLFGFERDELDGIPLRRLIPSLASTERLSASMVEGRSRSGDTLFLDLQINYWRTSGDVPRATVLIRDVSEQTRTSRKLTENELRSNRALHEGEIGVFDINLTTGRSIASDSWFALMDVHPDEVKVNPQAFFHARIHPEDRHIVETADKDCIESRTERSISEYRIRASDGSWRWMRSVASVVERDANGKALRLLGVQSDITSLREAQSALRQSEERFRIFLSHAPVGMAVFNRDGYFVGLNEAMVKLTGYSETELLSMRFRDLMEDCEVASILDAIAKQQLSRTQGYQGEHRILGKSGEARWGLVNISWTFDVDRTSDVYIVQIQDISERHEIERLKSQFVATVSHELRTPLTSVKGALDLITGSMSDKLPKSSLRLLDIATINTNRLINLVNDILDLEKISAGRIDFHFEPESANLLVESAVSQTRTFAIQHDVHLNWRAQPDDYEVLADAGRLNQVLVNLISNACKFSKPGGKVELSFAPSGDMIKFIVRDEGVGIPAAKSHLIFRPFQQIDGSDTRERGGSGLGLNICRELLERMGGSIDFASKEGQGTTFWFCVPKAPPQAAGLPESLQISEGSLEELAPVRLSLSEPNSDEPAEGSQRMRILHVDADDRFTRMVSQWFDGGADVTAAHSLDVALEEIRNASFDVVLIDHNMVESTPSPIVEELGSRQPAAKIVPLNCQGGDLFCTGPSPYTDGTEDISRSLDRMRTQLRSVS
ncbi:PAS domain S-box protein [Pelagovum pacificum]|uniref:PAS domain S-box protein n=1 Tax=Pelagovum pacificum TaxID=2588711 RepID=UPI0018E2A495|nr:PAS domain S-box protein [Pelagovum pacificum]